MQRPLAKYILHMQHRAMGITMMQSVTCAKYSSEMRPAHSIHSSSGRQGLEMSAHLMSMRFTRIRFSGDVKMPLTDSSSPFPWGRWEREAERRERAMRTRQRYKINRISVCVRTALQSFKENNLGPRSPILAARASKRNSRSFISLQQIAWAWTDLRSESKLN